MSFPQGGISCTSQGVGLLSVFWASFQACDGSQFLGNTGFRAKGFRGWGSTYVTA